MLTVYEVPRGDKEDRNGEIKIKKKQCWKSKNIKVCTGMWISFEIRLWYEQRWGDFRETVAGSSSIRSAFINTALSFHSKVFPKANFPVCQGRCHSFTVWPLLHFRDSHPNRVWAVQQCCCICMCSQHRRFKKKERKKSVWQASLFPICNGLWVLCLRGVSSAIKQCSAISVNQAFNHLYWKRLKY